MQTLLRLANIRAQPWQNAGGQTRELMRWPMAAELDRIAWRISIADIERDGAFSRFPDMQRSLVLLQGAGMQLRVDDDRRLVSKDSPRIDFDGSSEAYCQLIDGPTLNLNLIWRPACGSASLSLLALNGAQDWLAPAGQTLALCWLRGSAHSELGSLQAGDLIFGDQLQLQGRGECALMQLSR